MVGSYYLFGLDARATALGDLIQARVDQNIKPVLDPEQQRLRWTWLAFWIGTTIVLMTIVFLVAIDIWAIRRYGRRHMQQINADRRAMVEDQLARHRSERNGHV
jgi:hypothetical protein